MENNDIFIMNEVAMPEGLSEAGITADLSAKKICPKCGKTKDKCSCNK